MDKSIINWPIFLILLLQGSCTQMQKRETFLFKIENPRKEQLKIIKLKKIWPTQEMVVVENTLNDTCLIGIMKIPPRVTGKLYRVEFFDDSILYSYYPYKASKGKLIIKHIFY